MLDFTELSKDGNDLELLIREIFLVKGSNISWSGKGPDGGKDLILYEKINSELLNEQNTWLIQCKHKAYSGNSVGVGELDDIVDSCIQHDATRYLLVCTTYPSSGVTQRLEGITDNPKNDIKAIYWDAVKIEQVLSTPKMWTLAQRFFPISSKNSPWDIYATETPNHWIANHRGYHFYLFNRIGSTMEFHFTTIDYIIDMIQKIQLPEKHFIRIRAIYFDDKHGNYSWYLDYMYPHSEEPKVIPREIKYILGDEKIINGLFYSFDVISRTYSEYSDHYDKDHYDYYVPFLSTYKWGGERKYSDKLVSIQKELLFKDELIAFKDTHYNKIKNIFQSLTFAKLINSYNAEIENMDKFYYLFDWSSLIEELELESDCFFSMKFIFDVSDETSFIKYMELLPQKGYINYRLTRVYVGTPKMGGFGSEITSDDTVFELTFSIVPLYISTSYNGRKIFNEYIDECISNFKSN